MHMYSPGWSSLTSIGNLCLCRENKKQDSKQNKKDHLQKTINDAILEENRKNQRS